MLEAAHADTRDKVLLEAQLKQYRQGVSSGGTGPSFAQRNYRRELDQAKRYGREINESGIGNTVDGNSGHRPPERRKKKKGKRRKRERLRRLVLRLRPKMHPKKSLLRPLLAIHLGALIHRHLVNVHP